ncbi:SDR family NAD(P)-dependent oxidoreductase [Streptomyces sp. NPDC057686]|uniref:SDR family NAD(P)-dependent oxidoreductase n=1 Tax=Streptomyces sp. NPDC057686 TaxID=3346212 RepID=UPI0036CA9322
MARAASFRGGSPPSGAAVLDCPQWCRVAATRRPVAVAALNAGVGEGGVFLDTDLEDEFEIVDLNVRSTVPLAKRLLWSMSAAGEGRMLITSSIASTMPGSFQAVCNASKSFLQSFSRALQNELKDTPLTVTARMPGPTDTDFLRRADMGDTKVGQGEKDDPAQVAEQGLDALFAGKDRRTPPDGRARIRRPVVTGTDRPSTGGTSLERGIRHDHRGSRITWTPSPKPRRCAPSRWSARSPRRQNSPALSCWLSRPWPPWPITASPER